jgi:phosphatidylglycerol---prolipoprotein diacylglyceryl transferase
VGAAVIRSRAVVEHLDPEKANRLTTWIWVPGFIVAHVFECVVYQPEMWIKNPLSIFWIWQSLSSFGGFIGAVVGAWIFTRRHKTKPDTWRYLDVVAYAFVFGWIFGRLGCTLAYDHAGRETTFLLAQVYTDGKARFNLGMIEGLYFLPLAAIFFALGRKRRPAGFYVGLLCLLYGPFRFFIDFARYADVRYFGLTPAQWGSVVVTVAGIAIMRTVLLKHPQSSVEAAHLPIIPQHGG